MTGPCRIFFPGPAKTENGPYAQHYSITSLWPGVIRIVKIKESFVGHASGPRKVSFRQLQYCDPYLTCLSAERSTGVSTREIFSMELHTVYSPVKEFNFAGLRIPLRSTKKTLLAADVIDNKAMDGVPDDGAA
ncbi:hypothetical protein J6590_078415 [Homalodisca vitripennis]|nr:hypothetical protein J6590_078415 [Homalodisca vitripennis]